MGRWSSRASPADGAAAVSSVFARLCEVVEEDARNKTPARYVDAVVTTRDLTAAQFNETIENNDIVLVDFWASWCGPCRQFAPTFRASSEKHPDVVFAKVDTEAEQDLAQAAQIRSIPTLMAFKKGKLLFNQPGALPQAALEDLLEQVKAFDVEAAEQARQDEQT